MANLPTWLRPFAPADGVEDSDEADGVEEGDEVDGEEYAEEADLFFNISSTARGPN